MADNVNQAISHVELEENIIRAGGDQLQIISQLLPYLSQRHLVALTWRSVDAKTKKELEEIIEMYNTKIKLILGLK